MRGPTAPHPPTPRGRRLFLRLTYAEISPGLPIPAEPWAWDRARGARRRRGPRREHGGRLLPPHGASPQNVDQHLFTLPQGYGQFAFGIFDDSFEIPTFPTGAQAEEGRDPESRRDREQHPRHRYGARQPRARLSARRAAGRHEGVPTLEG